MTDAGARDASLTSQEFVRFALECGVLRFGEFVTKAGRLSPYFFNAGLFNDGEKMGRLAAFYAHAILGSGIGFDMLFGPAYKGIPLAVTVAVELARRGRNVPWAYNRKEAKDHGEGGVLVGAPVRGRVLIVDDVISAGTALRESVGMIQAAGAQVCGVAIALDRQEKGVEDGQDTSCSAVQHIQRQMNVPVCAIAGFDDLVHYLQNQTTTGAEQACMARIIEYRRRYGVTSQPEV